MKQILTLSRVMTVAFFALLMIAGLQSTQTVDAAPSQQVVRQCRALDGKSDRTSLQTYSNKKCNDVPNCTVDYSSSAAIIRCGAGGDTAPDGRTIDPEYSEGDCVAGRGGFGELNSDNCGILKYIILITNVLSGLAATIIVAMIILGGIQYSAAGADPSKVQAAKQKIYNALLALVLLVFGYAILQYLVPGGIF